MCAMLADTCGTGPGGQLTLTFDDATGALGDQAIAPGYGYSTLQWAGAYLVSTADGGKQISNTFGFHSYAVQLSVSCGSFDLTSFKLAAGESKWPTGICIFDQINNLFVLRRLVHKIKMPAPLNCCAAGTQESMSS